MQGIPGTENSSDLRRRGITTTFMKHLFEVHCPTRTLPWALSSHLSANHLGPALPTFAKQERVWSCGQRTNIRSLHSWGSFLFFPTGDLWTEFNTCPGGFQEREALRGPEAINHSGVGPR